jgi:hypothetical protein
MIILLAGGIGAYIAYWLICFSFTVLVDLIRGDLNHALPDIFKWLTTPIRLILLAARDDLIRVGWYKPTDKS